MRKKMAKSFFKPKKTKQLNVPITVPENTTDEQITTLQSDLSEILSMSLSEIHIFANAMKDKSLKAQALFYLKTQL